MIKTAAVSRIDERRAVVSPSAAWMRLMAARGDHRRFALSQRIGCIRYEPPGVANMRIYRIARNAVSDRDVPKLIHVETRHPPPKTIRPVVEGLLLQRG